MDKNKVLKLATLARIEMSAEEADGLSNDLESILGYVSEIKEASVPKSELSKENFPVRNVFREDSNPHESGIHTEDLLSQAPNREGSYIKVKKIL